MSQRIDKCGESPHIKAHVVTISLVKILYQVDSGWANSEIRIVHKITIFSDKKSSLSLFSVVIGETLCQRYGQGPFLWKCSFVSVQNKITKFWRTLDEHRHAAFIKSWSVSHNPSSVWTKQDIVRWHVLYQLLMFIRSEHVSNLPSSSIKVALNRCSFMIPQLIYSREIASSTQQTALTLDISRSTEVYQLLKVSSVEPWKDGL